MRFNGVFQHHPRTRATSRDGATLPPPPPKLPSSLECRPGKERWRGGEAHRYFPRLSAFFGAFFLFLCLQRRGARSFPKEKKEKGTDRKPNNFETTVCLPVCGCLVSYTHLGRGGGLSCVRVERPLLCPLWLGGRSVHFPRSLKLKHPPSPTLLFCPSSPCFCALFFYTAPSIQVLAHLPAEPKQPPPPCFHTGSLQKFRSKGEGGPWGNGAFLFGGWGGGDG